MGWLRHLLAVDQRLMDVPLLGDVAQHGHGPAHRAPVLQRPGVRDDVGLCGRCLRSNDEFLIVHGLTAQGARQCRVGKRQGASRRPD